MPYISATIFIQIAGAVVPTVEKMQKDEEGRKKLTQWTRYVTVVLAVVAGLGLRAVHRVAPGRGRDIRASASSCRWCSFLTTGAIFVMWLGEQITERGLGNGASLIIFFSIVERFWPGIGDDVRLRDDQARSAPFSLVVLGGRHGRGRRRRRGDHDRGAAHPDPDPAAHDGARAHARGGEELHPAPDQHRRRDADHLRPVGHRRSGRDRAVQRQPVRAQDVAELLRSRARGCTTCCSAVLIVFFTYFYTSIIFNPVDLAENLKKQGGFIPGVKPGAKTAEYIDHGRHRASRFPGAIFLTFIALLPVVHRRHAINVPFRFGGTSLLIVVGVRSTRWRRCSSTCCSGSTTAS